MNEKNLASQFPIALPHSDRDPAVGFQAKAGPSAVHPGRRLKGVMWLVAVAVVVVVTGYAIIGRTPHRRSAASSRVGGANVAFPVAAEPARKADLDRRLVALGTVTPLATVTIRSRVDGELQKLFFKEGEKVEAGAPLADLDPRPFEVQKRQGEAQLAKDNALLENARVDLQRFQTLLAEDSVAEQQVETQAALVRQDEAAVKVDESQVQSADLLLAYAHITAPITGRIGLRSIDQGNIVRAADANGLAVITQLDPISVLFSVPEDAVPQVVKRFKMPGAPTEVQAFDRDGSTLLATGRLVTVDNQIDLTTGTVKLRAEFPNADEALFPNQFVNVQIVVDQLKDVTVVPAAAVQRGSAGTFVYVVGPENKAMVRPVVTGPTEKGSIVIAHGVVPGDVVVVDGLDKLREGSPVEIISQDSTAPTVRRAPNAPENSSGKRAKPGATPAKS